MLGKVSTTPLPLLHVAIEAAWRCWRLRRELLWVLVLPVASIVTLNLWRSSRDTPWIMGVALMLADVVVLGFAAASCLRVILLGPRSVPRLGVNGRQMREWICVALFFSLYLLSMVLLTAFTSIVRVPYAELLEAGANASKTPQILALLPVLFIICRLLLVLPARAVDTPITFRVAWRMSEGNGWRLVLLTGALPWFLHLAEYTVADLFASDTDYTIIRSILYVLLLPLEVALLSASYRYLCRAPQPATEHAQQTP